ncbi:MAG: lipopolysaccharide biosynthesis protein [Methylocystis sp.]
MTKTSPALHSFALFGASVLLSKGLSIISIPVVARHLAPTEYGRLELIASIIEICGLVMTFGLADSLFRFASSETAARQREIAAGLTGSALMFAAVAGVLFESAAWIIVPASGHPDLAVPIAFGLGAATLSGLIEMPLAWLRLRNQPGLFLLFTASRSILQVCSMIATLSLGFGVNGIIGGNAVVDLCLTTLLVARQIKSVGIHIDRESFERAASYGMPIVGGSLSMFVLGACDRLFLAASVDASELGFYGLAAKLSFVVPLVLQPFGLWWYARRFAVLDQPGGLARSSRMISIGMILLGAGVALACGGAPIFIAMLMPPAYRGALPYLSWLALIAALNELCSLLNVGVYAARNGFGVLAINGIGALVALFGYVTLVPDLGVFGAIAATIAGQAARLALFLFVGRRRAPIGHSWGLLLSVILIDFLLVRSAGMASGLLEQGFVLVAAIAMFGGLAWRILVSSREPAAAEALA